MKTFLALLRSLAGLLDAFVDAGGVQILVEYLRQRTGQAQAAARLADHQRLEAELASGDPARVERAAAELLDATEGADHHWPGAGAGSGQSSGHSDDHPGAIQAHDSTLEGLQREAESLGLAD